MATSRAGHHASLSATTDTMAATSTGHHPSLSHTTATMAASRAAHPTRSATTIVSLTEYHTLKIEGHSGTINTNCGQPIFNSSPFCAGGHTWHVRYRPKGTPGKNDRTNFIAIYLIFDDIVDEPVKAKVTFSLLGNDENPVPFYSSTTGMHDFSENSSSWGFGKFIERELLERSGHLKDDCFSIRVQIHIFKEEPPIMVPPSDMQQHLGKLLLTKVRTDVEFRVGEETFAAHRIVLGARSPVFKAELYGPMKEGATRNIIHIDDMEARVFKALLTFIYTDAWPEMDQEDESAMTQHLLVAADRYCMQRLKLMCEQRLCKHVDKSSVATILALAEMHHCCGLKEVCLEFLGSSTTLLAVIETEDLEYLAQSCPPIVKELTSNDHSGDSEKAEVLERIEKEINIVDICDSPPSTHKD